MPSFLQRLFRRDAALPSRTASSVQPDTKRFDELIAQAGSAAAAGDFESAIRRYEQAIAVDGSRAETYYQRANALKNAGRPEAAVASYDQAIERKRDYAHAYCNRGVVQQSLGLVDEALASYDRAIALDAGDFMAHYNRALALQERSRWSEALASYERAIDINPQFADAQYNRAMAQLFLGDFRAGWRGYEWRWANAQRLGLGEARTFAQARWLGEQPIAGKRLLLFSEAGLGDVLQFCRYATCCAELGATVILEAPAALLPLLGTLAGVAQRVATGDALPPFDCQSPLLSLPLAFGTTLDTIPAPARYLAADPARVAEWRLRLGERRAPRIGLAWSGNPNNPLDRRRSIALADWMGHLPAGADYFRLQLHLRESDRAALDSDGRIRSFEDGLMDFENTAALCECLDLVITVDTSLAHLAGALGVRTWVLLAHTPDFRWLQDRSDSPWYPTLKLYRQSIPGDWSGVFDRIAADLHEEVLAPRRLSTAGERP